MPFLKIHSTLPCKFFVFFDYVGEQCFCFQTIKHELGFRKRVVSTVSDRGGGKYPFRGRPNPGSFKSSIKGSEGAFFISNWHFTTRS